MKTKLKIGIIGTRGIPNRYGGFEAFAAHLAPRLVSKGHQVFVYCSHDQQFREKTLNGVNLVFCYNPESWIGTAGQFVYDLNCNLHAHKQHFDVILHLGYTSDSVWSGMWSKAAVHLTNMDGMEWARSKYSSVVQAFLKKAERRAALYSKLMIADSTAVLDYLEAQYAKPVRFISYGADIPGSYNRVFPGEFNVEPYLYDLLIARMEPENNIEMAVNAKINEKSTIPLLIFSNNTGYGNRLKKKYQQERMIRFEQAVYQPEILNSLRYYSRYYIHGHSAGGTNPSLLEAMACECRILAHENPFNVSVLDHNAGFYKDESQLTELLMHQPAREKFRKYAECNLNSIRNKHNWEFITNEYESAFYQALGC